MGPGGATSGVLNFHVDLPVALHGIRLVQDTALEHHAVLLIPMACALTKLELRTLASECRQATARLPAAGLRTVDLRCRARRSNETFGYPFLG